MESPSDTDKGNNVSVPIFLEVVDLGRETRRSGAEGEVAVSVEDAARLVLGFGIVIGAKHYRRRVPSSGTLDRFRLQTNHCKLKARELRVYA